MVGNGGVSYPCNSSYSLVYHCVLDTCTAVTPTAPYRALGKAGSDDYWVVGSGFIGHLVGGAWINSPHPGIGELYDVSGSAPDDVWAVGLTGFLHNDGRNWSVYSTTTGAQHISADSLTDAWAITNTTVLRYQPLQFTDVLPNNAFYSYIRCLACGGIISGYDDGSFRPGNEITRGQIAKIVSNAAGIMADPGPQIFEDVDNTNPFYDWINRLANLGYMGGYTCGGDGEPCGPGNLPYFRPFANATRGQLAKIAANAAGITGTPTGMVYTDVPNQNPFYVWIMRLTALGVISGYQCGGEGEPCDDMNRPYFRPNASVTRGQASKMVANTFFPACQTPAK